jgi:hypothetical protein
MLPISLPFKEVVDVLSNFKPLDDFDQRITIDTSEFVDNLLIHCSQF